MLAHKFHGFNKYVCMIPSFSSSGCLSFVFALSLVFPCTSRADNKFDLIITSSSADKSDVVVYDSGIGGSGKDAPSIPHKVGGSDSSFRDTLVIMPLSEATKSDVGTLTPSVTPAKEQVEIAPLTSPEPVDTPSPVLTEVTEDPPKVVEAQKESLPDRKSTRLNSSH